ncbi:MAG: sulfatase-like hydrolase/transferase [Planctomycetota bacterium]|nr:sulfatase-like hydrolase/transferase [Planctomycetota bacterium]
MKARAFAALTLMVVAALVNAVENRAAERPNIILVMADDQGWGDMAYNGHPVIKTPNFDAAAAAGLRFDRFYAAAPVCSPTRASVMTGRHPNRMGVFKWGYPMRPQETTIAEALKTAGYATGHFGKWHLGSVRNDSPAHPGRNGFDEWLSAPNFYDNDAIMSRQGTAVPMKGESSMIAVDAALEWMKEKTKGDDPFLAVVWFGSPHSPHVAAEEDRKLYEEHSKALQNFYGEVTGMDRAFGKLRDSLTDLGIRENTILWYCSDNGGLPKVGSTGGFRGNKGQVYEGGLLVPAILEWPAHIKQPRTTDMRCNTCDIYPTLLEIAGVHVERQAPLDGISLVALIDEQTNDQTRAMGFWDYTAPGIGTPSAAWMADLWKAQQAGGDLPPHESSQKAAELPNPAYSTSSFPGHSAWTDGDWKLHRIEGKNGNAKWELYDLAADPKETEDVSESESDRVASMRGDLDKWLVSVVNSLNGEDYAR